MFVKKRSYLDRVADLARKHAAKPFSGKTAGDLQAWFESQKFDAVELDGKQISLKSETSKLGRKTVYIMASAGEDVQEIEYVEEQPADAELTPEEDGVAEQMPKSKSVSVGGTPRQADVMSEDTVSKAAWVGASMMTPEVSRRISAAKSYERQLARKSVMVPWFGACDPVFQSADEAELFRASVVMELASKLASKGMGREVRRAADVCKALSSKFLNTYDNAAGGSTVFPQFGDTIISLKPSYGACSQAVTAFPMDAQTMPIVKEGDDVEFDFIGEGDAIDEKSPKTSVIQLVAKKDGGLVKVTSELMRSSSISISDYLARKMARAQAQFEDKVWLNGKGSVQGYADLVGANTTHDAALSASWSEIDIPDIQSVYAKLSSSAQKGRNAIVCNSKFFHQVMQTFGLSAGGNKAEDIMSGTGRLNNYTYNGDPIYFTDVMPHSYAADTLPMYVGAFELATTVGVVNGSARLDVSEHRYFDSDIVAFRYLTEMAINNHGANNKDLSDQDASAVAALKV